MLENKLLSLLKAETATKTQILLCCKMIFFKHQFFWPTSTTTVPNQDQYSYFTQAQYEFGFHLQLLELLLSSCKHLEPRV